MIDHFSAAMAGAGFKVSVIAPAYACFRQRWAQLPKLLELQVPIDDRLVTVRVRSIHERHVTVHLLEAANDCDDAALSTWFAMPYPPGDAAVRLTGPVILARGSLLLLESLADLRGTRFPDVLLTNDWVAALTTPYAHHAMWARGANNALGAMTRTTLSSRAQSGE